MASPGTGGGASGAPLAGAAGAQHDGAGAAQVGAGAQHVAGPEEQQLLRQPQRASAVSQQAMSPAVQITAAVANLNMISLLQIASRSGEVERQASPETAWDYSFVTA